MRVLFLLYLVSFGIPSLFAEELASEKVEEADRSEEPNEASQSEEILAGHSYHGDAFNEGARQSAYLMSGTGNVHFPTTSKSDEVQKYINQGVGQLHGFWYLESERSFRQAAAIDPDCAIAYWGMAMSNRRNAKRARGFIEEALERKDQASEREQMYIDALAKFFPEQRKEDEKKKSNKSKEDEKEAGKKRAQSLIKAYEGILHKYPEDLEAKAFLGLALYENRSKGIPISSYYAVDALFKSILAENPLHPCHHFVIHLWDYEEPKLALESAAKCGASAPSIAHMWHMPGHTYSRLHRYHDAAWQQEASARTDHAHMMRDRLLPDQIHNFAHNNEWLITNLIHIGRAHDAIDLAKNMIDLPRHPKYNTLSKRGSSKYGRLRLMQVLSSFHMWDEVLALQNTIYLEPTENESEQIKRNVLIATAKFHSGDVNGGSDMLTPLMKQLTQVETEQEKAGLDAASKAKDDGKNEKEQKQASDKARREFSTKVRNLTQAVNELKGHLHYAHRAYADAASSFAKVSSFDKGWLAHTQELAGKEKEAIAAIKKHVSSHEGEVLPLIWQVRVLWEAGKKDDAKAAFETLREISSTVAIDLPMIQPLQAISEELEYGADWRKGREIPADFGNRPPLESLGPFRWSPSTAPQFALQDYVLKTRSLNDYAGKPVVVIFYLGFGCLHCAEQLQEFGPKTKEFNDLGISLIAVSTDNQENLKQSHENYGDEEFPFPLVSDSDLEVFKRYRCYDDFESQPLHGTFLIDAEGRIRWQDISYEPFMDADFLLEESQRLLGQPKSFSGPETSGVTLKGQ